MTTDNDNPVPPGAPASPPPANEMNVREFEVRFNIVRAASQPQDSIAVLAGAVQLLELSEDPYDKVLAKNIRRAVAESFTSRTKAYGPGIVGADGRPIGSKPKLVLS